ncbi:TonB-dependent siderophore receptor [Acinetobacter sp. MD2]|uniref:TonB-dependent receptor n=1 Tax=Acinetobacter sp. MD2 TaxID=2600066 RepID=UPI002D1F4619|nr:TonB-dependent siderophore receptor [Acinetobacter sp. MD2]MEB3766637.1 TonB-dependent siderophore receptor [Acinetobacter sp. MD2]
MLSCKFHPTWASLLLLQIISSTALAVENTDLSKNTIALPLIHIKTEQSSSNADVSQALTQFQHALLDVPFAQSHISTAEIQQHNIQRVSDALALVNGVVYQDSYGGGFWDNYSFRGFSTDPNMGTMYLRNGLSALNGIHPPQDMVNVQAIDFLKGPMAAMYGQGAIGGMLNITTKQPEWQPQHELNVSASTLQQYRIALDSTAAINDVLAYRMGIAYENNQSFRDDVNHQHYTLAPQLAWKISDHTQLNLDTEFSQYQGVFDRGIPMLNGKMMSNIHTFYGEPSDGKLDIQSQMLQLRLNHQFNDNWNSTTALSYSHGTREGTSTEISSVNAADLTANRFRRYRYFETKNTQFQSILRGKIQTGNIHHELLANIEAGHYSIDQLQQRNAVGTSSVISLIQPIYDVNILPLTRTTKSSQEAQNMLGFSLQDQVFLNDRWSVLMAGRYNHLEQNIHNHLNNVTVKQAFTPFSPRLGVNFKATPQLSFYSNWGKSFELNTGLNKDNMLYQPEQTQSWEVGGKYQYQTQSWLGLTYFNLHKQHLLTEGIHDSYVDSGKVQSHGIEVEVQQQITDQLKLRANYSFTDASVLESEVDVKGAQLKNIPKHTANLSADYQFNWQGYDMGMIGNLNYYGKRSANYIDNGTTLSAFTVVNMGGYWQIHPDLRMQLNISNLFNRKYAVASYTDAWIQPGEPRKATLSMNFKF